MGWKLNKFCRLVLSDGYHPPKMQLKLQRVGDWLFLLLLSVTRFFHVKLRNFTYLSILLNRFTYSTLLLMLLG